MSTETIEEISKMDLIVQTVTKAEGRLIAFIIIVICLTFLSAIDKLTADQFIYALVGSGLVSSILKK